MQVPSLFSRAQLSSRPSIMPTQSSRLVTTPQASLAIMPTRVRLIGSNPSINPANTSFIRVTHNVTASGNVTILPGISGQRLTLHFPTVAGTAVYTDGIGNLQLSSTFSPVADDSLELIYDIVSANWIELSRQTPTGGGLFDATCDASIAVGDLVYLSSANTVALANIDDDASGRVVGMVDAKHATTTARVRTSGKVNGLTGLTAGTRYYCSSAGVPTDTRPTGTEGAPKLATSIGVAINSTTLALSIAPPVRVKS